MRNDKDRDPAGPAQNVSGIALALQRLFPGMIDFLKVFPSARIIRLAKPKAISKALRPADKRKTPAVSAEQILEAAKRSVASPSLAERIDSPREDCNTPAFAATTPGDDRTA
ncbi:MAG: hypothetical protein M0C28_05000 [Candidatus Moduliflexus flocculans]|nr:hypothetical protein [Candidatus Moduliflexus flocculans]